MYAYHNELISHTMASANEMPELDNPPETPYPKSYKSVVWKQFGFPVSYNNNRKRVVDKTNDGVLALLRRCGVYERKHIKHATCIPHCTKLAQWTMTLKPGCKPNRDFCVRLPPREFIIFLQLLFSIHWLTHVILYIFLSWDGWCDKINHDLHK